MPEILVRNLDRRTLAALKKRAELHRTSVQQEVKLILEEAARTVAADAETVARKIRRSLAGKGIRFSDSGKIQAEDRRR
jgi:plasmid stability protein